MTRADPKFNKFLYLRKALKYVEELPSVIRRAENFIALLDLTVAEFHETTKALTEIYKHLETIRVIIKNKIPNHPVK